jgi:alpha-methylacyl-CoA racemase
MPLLVYKPYCTCGINGRSSTQTRNRHLNGGTFYDCYQTLDGRYLSIGGLEPQFFMAFANAIERPDLISLSIRHDAEAVTIVKTAISEAIAKKHSVNGKRFLLPSKPA